MNKTEKNILQGLYQVEKRPGEWSSYPYEAIRWLEGKGCWRTKFWLHKHGPHSGRFRLWNPAIAHSKGRRDLNSRRIVMQWLRYLEGKGLIGVAGAADTDIRLSLTSDGIDQARIYSSQMGRCEMLYRESKPGLLGLVITIATSVATTMITLHLSK